MKRNIIPIFLLSLTNFSRERQSSSKNLNMGSIASLDLPQITFKTTGQLNQYSSNTDF